MEEDTLEQVADEPGEVCKEGVNFFWQDYLDLTNSEQVPPDIFQHVEDSLQSELQNGMMLEVPHKDDPSKYWLATIVLACGPFSRMRYFGIAEDQGRDFWGDLTSINARPLNWCAKEGKKLVPPEGLPAENVTKEKVEEVLRTAKTVPAQLLSGDGFTPSERIKTGMTVEIQDCNDPYKVWVASIIENIGGRLLLRYAMPGSDSAKEFWLFYSSSRIFPMGWASLKGDPWKLSPPSDVDSDCSMEEWEAVLEMVKNEATKFPIPEGLFERGENPPHSFQVGWKVEALNPETLADIAPATVTKVWGDQYFLVEIDGTKHQWLCAKGHPYIFPVGWAAKKQIPIQSPADWNPVDWNPDDTEKQEFDWAEYLNCCDSQSAPASCFPAKETASDRGFQVNMKLEAVNPRDTREICVSTIVRTTDHLLWLHLESNDNMHPNHAVSVTSDLIFPASWCESNGYDLKPPQCYQQPDSCKSSDIGPTHGSQKSSESTAAPAQSSTQGSLWCPKIYFNHKCFSGPFLSKGKLAGLPQAVGPGPVRLVLREVLAMLISVAYKSSRVLKELQCEGQLKPGEHLEVMKAKSNQISYRARVAIVTSADRVPDFCQEVCERLQLCPYLFGPVKVDESGCPEKCLAQSKTKFTQYWLNRKRKPLRTGPPPADCALQMEGPRKRRGRRKRSGPRPGTRGTGTNRLTGGQDGDSDNSNDSGVEHSPGDQTSGVRLATGASRQWNSSASEASSAGGVGTRIVPDRASLKRPREEDDENQRANKIAATAVTAWLNPLPNLDSNPLFWTIDDVAEFVANSDENLQQIAKYLRDQEIDGQAFLMMNLPTAVAQLKLRPEIAVHLCRQVARIKVAFFKRYVYNM